MQKKGVTPSLVIVLALFLIVVSIVGVITVNSKLNSKMSDLARYGKSTNQGEVSVNIGVRPSLEGNVAVYILNPTNNQNP